MNLRGAFVLGMAVGVAAGLSAALVAGGGGASPRAAAEDPAPPPTASRPGLGAAPAPAGEPATDAGVAERFEAWYAALAETLPNPRAAHAALWLGLVSAYAAALRAADLERACHRALEHGVSPAALLETLERGRLSPDLGALVARHPDAGWDVRSRLKASGRGDVTAVLDALRRERERRIEYREGRPVGSRPSGDPSLDELLHRLAAADPARAAEEAQALMDASAWPPEVALPAARALRAHPALAARFVRAGLAVAPTNENLLELWTELDARAVEAYLAALLAKDPTSVAAWGSLVHARRVLGDAAGAFEAARRAAEIDPSHETLERLFDLDPAAALPHLARFAEASTDPALWDLRARAELRAGTATAALAAWLRGTSLTPVASWSYDDDADGWLALDPRRVADAMAPGADRALAVGADEFLAAYGRVLVEARDPRAFDVCRAAVERGAWYRLLGPMARADPARALPILEEHRARDPANLEVLIAIGEAHAAAGRRAEAVAALDRARAVHEARGGWEPDLATALARADPARGPDLARQAAEERGEWGLYGIALAAAGRTADARAAFEKALENDPESVRWRARLAALR